ncbi:MAG: putative secreted solute-binding protein (transport system associated) [Microbacteriaceae bacterium]|nr:putative secreted solute-binding protein (transport system associated) [Microbacteriaceae bacterium]
MGSIHQAFARGFEATHKNVKVKLETVTTAAKVGTNLTVVSSANAPDVGLIPTNTPAYQSLVTKGGIADLAPVWKAANLDKRYPASVNALTSFRGKHYVLALSTSFYGLIFYNADLFAKNHITVPSDHRIATASDLYAMASALKKGGVQPLEMGGKSGYQASWMVDVLLPTSASASQTTNYLSSWHSTVPVTAKYTDPAFVNVLKQLQEYGKNGVYQNGYLGADQGSTESAFMSGTSGMLLDGSWQAGVMAKAKLPFKVGWMLVPPVKASSQTQLTGFYGADVIVPAKAKHKDLAMQFLEYMVSDEGQQKAVIDVGSQIPSVNTVPKSAFTKLDPLVQQMLQDANTNGAQSGWTSTVPAGIGQTTIDPLIQSMYAGSATPDSIGQTIQVALPGVRAQNK